VRDEAVGGCISVQFNSIHDSILKKTTIGSLVKYLFLLGNGFTIDLLFHLNELETYPVSNIFSYGDKLSWPGSPEKAFISFKNTPNLWLLGVRPNNSAEQNNQIIENIITCANALYLKKDLNLNKEPSKLKAINVGKGDIYINAYRELVIYLKYLFVLFDKSVDFDPGKISEWPWARLFTNLDRDDTVSDVYIVTLNYDLWLERTLDTQNIRFKTAVIENSSKTGKFQIIKPHGSISFMHKKERKDFSINYDKQSEIFEGSAKDFEWKMKDLDKFTMITPLIPPAGESSRFNATWAGDLRKSAIDCAQKIEKDDRVIVSGLSYWHVDRREIDEILLSIDDQCEISCINPSPPEALDSVLTSLFDNYDHYTTAERYIGGLYA